MNAEESQNKKRPASARTSRTKPRGKGISAVYRSMHDNFWLKTNVASGLINGLGWKIVDIAEEKY